MTITADSADATTPYLVQAVLEFKDIESYTKAGESPEAKEILGDVSRFSDQHPVLMGGEVINSSA